MVKEKVFTGLISEDRRATATSTCVHIWFGWGTFAPSAVSDVRRRVLEMLDLCSSRRRSVVHHIITCCLGLQSPELWLRLSTPLVIQCETEVKTKPLRHFK